MGKFHDLIDRAQRYKGALHSFFLDLTSWKKFDAGMTLNWQRVKFGPGTRNDVPEERGIYAFTLEVGANNLPSHGYIMYVGITGNKSSANLRGRYSQYLRNLTNEDGRPKVCYMLLNWRDDLIFNFVPIPDKAVDLLAIERSFINSVMPPVNSADFEADIAAPKKAAF